ncbi:GDSL-type esterase/lipase family protein [Paenibacillus sinopodophylli]|uniref:GDSL-type esterase/lipase family protein n=1 Tax=Paenibacillus sinopodophylli TaxID=1837342 RepID=UPI00110D0939|nr:GDSL-type esterase/lipase family protein [Paenibacillus sinopodophylli]
MYSKLRKVSVQTAASLILAVIFTTILSNQSLTHQSKQVQAASQTKQANTDAYHIVALGDSVTAGYEKGFTELSIPYGYVEHVYEQALFQGYRTEYENYGVLGLRTAGLKRWMDAVVISTEVKSTDIQTGLPDPRAEQLFSATKQLRSSIMQSDLILITIGGNDMYAVLEKLEEGADQSEAASVLETALNRYEAELESSLRSITSLQPKVQIIIADQYLPIPKPVRLGALVFPLYPEADRLFLESSVKQLRERLNQIVQRLTKEGYQVKIANVAAAFVDNELRYTSIADGDIHPNHAGYAAMGTAFAKAVWGEYRVAKPKEPNQPVHILVKGKELPGTSGALFVHNRTFVPLRSATVAMGGTIKWNARTQTASISLDSNVVDITSGSSKIKVNGVTKLLEAPPAFMHAAGKAATLYVPLAALSEGLQFQVVYRDTLKAVFINK